MSTNIFESTSFDDLLKQAGVTALNPEITTDKTHEQIAEERTESYRVDASVLADEPKVETPVAQVWGSTEPSTGVVSDEATTNVAVESPVQGTSNEPSWGTTGAWGATSTTNETPAETWGATSTPNETPTEAWGATSTPNETPSEGSWASLAATVPEEKPSNTTVFEPASTEPELPQPVFSETPATAASDDLKPLIRQVVIEVLSDILKNMG